MVFGSVNHNSPTLVKMYRRSYLACRQTVLKLANEQKLNASQYTTLELLSFEIKDLRFAYKQMSLNDFMNLLNMYDKEYNEQTLTRRLQDMNVLRETFLRHRLKSLIIFKTFHYCIDNSVLL